MKKIKTSLVFLIAMSMVLTLVFSGCSKDTKTTDSTASTASTSTSTSTSTATTATKDPLADMSKKLEITWLIAGDASAYKEGTLIEKTLEDKFNVDLKTIPINSMDDEKFNVTIASGTIPDVIVRWNHQKLYSDGIVRSFPIEMIKKYMPKSQKLMDEVGGSAAWQYSIAYTDGKNFGIPQISISGGARLVLAVRKDWLDNVGITKLPTTIDEIHDAAKAFTFNDPDKNGKKDTYGLGGAGMHPNPLFWQFQTIFGAYGVHPQYWSEENGKVVFGPVANGYKDALKLLNSWYKEGIIDPEFVTDQNANYSTKVSTGVLGFYDGHPTYFDPESKTSAQYLIKQKDPKAEYVFLDPPKGPSGKSGAISYGVVATWPMMFGAKTSDEKMVRAMMIGEALNTDLDLFNLTFSGTKDVDYDKSGDLLVAKAGLVPAEKGIKIYRTGSYLTWDVAKTFLSKAAITMIEPTIKHKLLVSVVDATRLTTLFKDKINQADMDKVVKEFYFNAITGKVNIDSEWDKYTKQWMDLGGKVLTDEAQKAPRVDK